MHNITTWKRARRPNYMTNVDKTYPYSEVPFLGDYQLVKLPVSPSSLVDHVDYWGEGKIVTQHGSSGFTNCYNVNHAFQLVSNGVDRDRKIPNRIPVITYAISDTSAYIKDDSVLTVTVMGAPIIKSCAEDIARMANSELGKVVVYGFDNSSQDIQNLTASLKTKRLYHYSDYKLPEHLQGMSLFNSQIAFLNITELKNQLCKLVTDGEYDTAVKLTKSLDIEVISTVVSNTVQDLLKSNSTVNAKLMSYAYKLWTNKVKNNVEKYFPVQIKLIVGEDNVTVVNTEFQQALKLDTRESGTDNRLAWGDSKDKISNKVNWKFIPVWLDNDVTFYMYNVEYDMYLRLDDTTDSEGDRKAKGSKETEDRHRFYLEPCMKDGSLVFYIINCKYRQGLKLLQESDATEDKQLMGHTGDIYNGERRFRWTINAFQTQS